MKKGNPHDPTSFATEPDARTGINHIYNRRTDCPNWPDDFIRASIEDVKIKNQALLRDLRDHEPGEWKKVYEDGYSRGRAVSVHYFRSRSGKIFDLDVKLGWSNSN